MYQFPYCNNLLAGSELSNESSDRYWNNIGTIINIDSTNITFIETSCQIGLLLCIARENGLPLVVRRAASISTSSVSPISPVSLISTVSEVKQKSAFVQTAHPPAFETYFLRCCRPLTYYVE